MEHTIREIDTTIGMLRSEVIRLRVENEAVLGKLAQLLLGLGTCSWCGGHRRQIGDIIKSICEPLSPCAPPILKKHYALLGRELVCESTKSE